MKRFHIYLLLVLILTSCTVTRPYYLQNAKRTKDETYGLTKENPIHLKYSKHYGYDTIIEGYIGRLYTCNLEEFFIQQKEILGSDSNTDVVDKDILKQIFRYRLVTEVSNKPLILYFKLTKRKKKFYHPVGTGYSYLSGTETK